MLHWIEVCIGLRYLIEILVLVEAYGQSKIKLEFDTTYHLEKDHQVERMIKTLEDMFRACTLDKQ